MSGSFESDGGDSPDYGEISPGLNTDGEGDCVPGDAAPQSSKGLFVINEVMTGN